MLQMSQIEKPRCSATIDQMRFRWAMNLPVDFQNVSSSGFQSEIQVGLRLLISMFLSGWGTPLRGQAVAGGVKRKTKSAAARRSKASLQGGGVAGCVCDKAAAPPAMAALGLSLYKLRANPGWARKSSVNQRANRLNRNPSAFKRPPDLPCGKHKCNVQRKIQSFQQPRGCDHRLSDLGDFLVLVHGRLAQQAIGRVFGEIPRRHEDALGAVDDLALLERGARAFKFLAQTREGIKTRDGEIEDVLDALLAQAADDIGGDAGIDRSLDRRLVTLLDEHGNRPFHGAAHLEHLLEHVAARCFEINQNDVGVKRADASDEVRATLKAHQVGVAGLAHGVFQDRSPGRILVDDDDLERGSHGASGNFQAPCQNGAELNSQALSIR